MQKDVCEVGAPADLAMPIAAARSESALFVMVEDVFADEVLHRLAAAFATQFPSTPLRLVVEGSGARILSAMDSHCGLGILAALPVGHTDLCSEAIGELPLVTVACANHPLARVATRISRAELARHVQLVRADRSDLIAGKDFCVTSAWRLPDRSTQHALLKENLGWAIMPLHRVKSDIENGSLVMLDVDDLPPTSVTLPLSAVHKVSSPPGSAARWLIDYLKACH